VASASSPKWLAHARMLGALAPRARSLWQERKQPKPVAAVGAASGAAAASGCGDSRWAWLLFALLR